MAAKTRPVSQASGPHTRLSSEREARSAGLALAAVHFGARRSLLALPWVLLGCGGDPAPVTDAGEDVAFDDGAFDDVVIDAQARDDRPGDPRLRVYVTDEIRAEPIPCKLTVTALPGTRRPFWGDPMTQVGMWIDRENRALAQGHWILMARGRADVMLPPGRYRLTVSRGMEYESATELVEIGQGVGAVMRAELRRVVNTEGYIGGEFHVHSMPSFDSDVPLDQRALSLAAEGVEVFASTDHDALGDFAPAIREMGLSRHIHWIKGDEITADGFGHFGVYPLPDGVDPATQLTHDEPTVMGILARARAVAPGAILQLNHPMWREHPIGYWNTAGFDPVTGMSQMELASVFDTVEVWNSHTLDEDARFNTPVDGVIDAWMATLQIGRGATAVGNSDTHRLSQTPPGWPRTFIRVPADDPMRVTDVMVNTGLRAGDATLTSGPMLRASINGVRAGGTVRAVDGQVTVHIDVEAPSFAPVDRVAVVVNRREVASRDLTEPADRGTRAQSWDIPLTVTRDAWVVVRTHAREPVREVAGDPGRPMASLALVNPIYVDFDGDGVWTAPGINGGP